MTGSTFKQANLSAIIIIQGDWSYTNLRGQHLQNLNLQHVNFSFADLSGARLEKSDLPHANLTMTTFMKANLREADLRGANMNGVNFRDFDLANVKIDFTQAVMMAKSFGARVEENE
ncbi:hypothetical protein AAC03nite_01750 [Alicyclobacillus acidoterrestris]|uniref:pentapeptide repeat-containing protein n=1 Tax=Alicyclobacillus suci TaxID=2816080 RepID=UPI001190F0BA|nr:hypothetical protein AAC03nite_01750 [Alicyclobacillus acidoterrestris]